MQRTPFHTTTRSGARIYWGLYYITIISPDYHTFRIVKY